MRRPRPLIFLLVAATCVLGLATPALAADDGQMTTVYLVLLKKGPAWGSGTASATQVIQDAHMANIRAMWEAHKLIVAGPVEDKAGLQGIYVFQVASFEEAKALAATDPAVKAGNLVAEVYPWWIAKGVFPEAGSYCTPPKK